MDQLADEVSNAQNKRVKRDREEMAKQERDQEDSNLWEFFDDVTKEMQLVTQQIKNRKDRPIIVFYTSLNTSYEVRLYVIKQVIKMFESKATVVSLIYDGKWGNNEYLYEKLKSDMTSMPTGKGGIATAFAIEYNTIFDRKFTQDHGTVDGKYIEFSK